MGLQDLALNIVLRSSILSQMDRKAEADNLIKTLKSHPYTKTRISKEYISRFFLDQGLVEQLYKGIKSVNIPLLTVA